MKNKELQWLVQFSSVQFKMVSISHVWEREHWTERGNGMKNKELQLLVQFILVQFS